MKNWVCNRSGFIALALAAMAAGCQRPESERAARPAAPSRASAVDLDAAMADALKSQRPVLVLIAESGRGDADDNARALLDDAAIKERLDRVTPILLDLGNSRNRARAARFHVTDTPLLVCLSPRGVIVSRDEKPITQSLVIKRIDEAAKQAPDLDAHYAALEDVRRAPLEPTNGAEPSQTGGKINLAEFLLAHHNAREAIPQLESVAHVDGAEASVRVKAWVDLARAHLWIAEPEKGRHEAQALMTTLGPTTPEALAGGNLVLGLQDANGKRFALARKEFTAAMSAAPDSNFAKQAAEALAALPKETK